MAARAIAAALGDALGQQVVVDNKPGAAGVIGAEQAAIAPSDGYSLVFGSATSLAANVYLYKVNFDPMKDFVPLAMIGTISFGLTVPATSPVKSVKELIALAKAKPGGLLYGDGSSSALLCGEELKRATGITLTNVKYRGTPQALVDLVAGRLDLICEPVSTTLEFSKSGKVRTLAVTSKVRSDLSPSLPTMAEVGLTMEHYSWAGFFAPAQVKKEIVEKLSSELVKVMRRPEIQEKVRIAGFEPTPLPANDLAEIHRADYQRLGLLIKRLGLTPAAVEK